MKRKNTVGSFIVLILFIVGVIYYVNNLPQDNSQDDLQSQIDQLNATNQTLQKCIDELQAQKTDIGETINGPDTTYSGLWDKINYVDNVVSEDPCN